MNNPEGLRFRMIALAKTSCSHGGMKFAPTDLQRHVLPALIAFAAAFGLAQTDLLERVENATLDLRTRWRATWRPTVNPPELVLIGIDEVSLREIGRWPWEHKRHGDFLQLLSLTEPSVVAWDILFTETAPDTPDLVDGIKASGLKVVLGAVGAKAGIGTKPGSPQAIASRLHALPRIAGDRAKIPTSPEMLLPIGPLAKAAEIGFVDTPPGSDGVRRIAPLLIRIGEDVYPTLSLQALIQYCHAVPEQVQVRLGEAITIETPGKTWRIPINANGGYLINYRGGLNGFTVYGYSNADVLLRDRFVREKPGLKELPFRDRILLVGQVADGLSDFGPTPFSPLTPLVLVHANVLQNILHEDFVHQAPSSPVWLGAFLVGAAGLAVFSDRKVREQIAFSIGIPTVYCLVATMMWVDHSWLFPVVGPLLGFGALQVFMIGRRVLVEQRAKDQIKGMFGTYVSPELVSRLVDSGKPPELGGHEKEITAYFSDIQGYSTFSEKLPPKQLVELLNDYLTVCTDTVQEQGGTLDKYIGDAVVAMFGAPIPLPDHAYRACVAALRVQEQLGTLRERWSGDPGRWPEGVLKMRSRIGMNSGPAIIGNMGSRTRFNYTMTGDNVNLAARMESGAKSWGAYTMCTEATKLACEQHGGDRVVFRPLGRIVVMGRTQAVPVFEVVALKESITQPVQECLGLFADALTKYYARDWQGAIKAFELSSQFEPHQPGKTPGVKSNPSLVYLGIVQYYLKDPPAADWGGVYVMTEK